MRVDWTDLRVFLHACETGSMTQAAARAHLTLAAVSARIRALEQEAGVLLLRRHARGVAATAAGEALARHARVVFQQLEALRRDVAGLPARAEAATVLLVNSSALARPLYPVIGDVLGGHPGARISMRESGSEVTVHALQSGAADLGIVTDAVAAEGLARHELGPDPLVLIAPPGHPLAGRGRLRFTEALAHAWVAWGEGSALHTHLVMQAHRARATLNAVASVPTAEGVMQLVVRGVGLTVLPRALLPQPDAARQVAVVELDEDWARRKLLLVRGSGSASPVAQALFEALRAAWPTLGDGRQRRS